jgi:AbrB family looped-hinge helix DNA binding protein
MSVTIDGAGRIVIPKALRERAGLVPGVELLIELDGTGIHIEPAAGVGLEQRGRFLTIPSSGDVVDGDLVDRLRREGQR